MRGPADGIFDSIAWGTDTVLDATLERARASGRTVARLPRTYDIDDAATLRRAAREHGSRIPALLEMARLLEPEREPEPERERGGGAPRRAAGR
jgi:hypothetical protein